MDTEIENLRDELIKNQKLEKKELQARIQRMKQTVPKNDKKRRKEMTTEIEQLEEQLKKRHEQALIEFDANEQLKKLSIDQESPEEIKPEQTSDQVIEVQNTRVSKAQRRREKKEQEEREREERIKKGEKENENHARRLEQQQLDELLRSMHLKIVDIPSDGDCMFKAIEHQLNIQNSQGLNVKALRKMTADTLRKDKDLYLPFLTSEKKADELMDEEEFEKYCNTMEHQKAWGGNVELQILAKQLNREIHVIQANGPIIKLNIKDDHKKDTPITLSYHRHAYQLGEHYNSLIHI